MTQLDDLQAFVNTELPRRPVLFDPATTDGGFDGDPNSGAPAQLQGAPVGTRYRNSLGIEYIKMGATATDWATRQDYQSNLKQVFLSPTGNDSNTGTAASPLLTLKRAAERNWESDVLASVNLASGSYPKHDWGADTGERLIFGSDRHILQINGAVTETGYTVASTSGLGVTVTPDPSWVVDSLKGDMVGIDAFGSIFWRPIISNTSDTIIVSYLPNTVGGFIPPPPNSSTINIRQLLSEITPASPDFFYNKMHYRGNVQFNFVRFKDAFTGLEAFNSGSNAFFQGCQFISCVQGLISSGTNRADGCYFKDCTSFGFSISDGLAVVDSCFTENCAIGYTAQFKGNLVIAGFSILSDAGSTFVMTGKTNGFISDESVRVYLDSPVNYMQLLRGCEYVKVSQPIVGISGFDSISGDYVQVLDVNNQIDLKDSGSNVLTVGGDFIDLLGVGISESTYVTAGRSLMGRGANMVVN